MIKILFLSHSDIPKPAKLFKISIKKIANSGKYALNRTTPKKYFPLLMSPFKKHHSQIKSNGKI